MHSPEPWKVCEAVGWIEGANGEIVVTIQNGGNGDIARMVACVNACQGINPEAVPLMMEVAERMAAAEQGLDSIYVVAELASAAISKAKESA